MAPIGVFIYFMLIAGTGMTITVRLDLPPSERFPAALVIGSCLIGTCLFFLAQGKLINERSIGALLVVCAILTSIQIRPLVRNVMAFAFTLKDYLFRHRTLVPVSVTVLLVIILWYFALAWTPPRSADAMRYHLAQIKDIIQSNGLEFRPYVHYNFPLNFSMLFLPIFLVFKGVGMQFAHLFYCFLSIAMTLSIAFRLGIRIPRVLLFLFLLTPMTYHQAHQVTNDWTFVFYIVCGLFLMTNTTKSTRGFPSRIYVAFLSLGFAFGVKYHAILFFPWFMFMSWNRLRPKPFKWRAVHVIGALGLMVLIASPWYVRNFINTGSPCWPLLLNFFKTTHNYLYLVAERYSESQTGNYSWTDILTNVKNIVFFPHIPFTFWILAGLGLVVNKRSELRLEIMLPLFFFLWWLFQPKYMLRFTVYIFPLALISVCGAYEQLRNTRIPLAKYGYFFLVGANLFYGIVLGVKYSEGYIQYHLTHDAEKYHRATHYYPEFQWINKNLPKEARILVIISHGQTYYLDREYVRAAPTLSGSIDWRNIKTQNELQDTLVAFNIDYILYRDADWSEAPGGANMMKLIRELCDSDASRIVWNRETLLCNSRIRGIYTPTKVLLIDAHQGE